MLWLRDRVYPVIGLLALLCVAAAAQYVGYSNTVYDSNGHYVAYATFRVCTYPATGLTCTPLATTYSSPTGGAQANPGQSDRYGGYSFYAAPGVYTIQLSGPGVVNTTIPYVLLPGPGSTLGYTVVAYSATPTFNAAQYNTFFMTLTGNVTVPVVANPTVNEYATFNLCQDATGGRTFAWPGSFVNPPTINPTASTCTSVHVYFDGTNWNQVVTGINGGTLSGTTTNLGTIFGGAVNPATLNGSPATAANFFTGSKTGNNPISSTTGNSEPDAADTGNSDRHFFDLKDTSDFDAVGGYTPRFFSGYWSSAAAGASYLERIVDWDAAQCGFTIQAYMYYTSSNSADYIGVTPASIPGGTISTPYYAVGFSSGNLIYNDAVNGATILVAAASLSNDTWYLVTFASVCDTTSTSKTPVISLRQISPASTFAYSTIISGSTLSATSNIIAESDSTSDLQFGLRYATGSTILPATSPTYSGAYYQQIDIPHSATAKMSAFPIQWTADNTAGGGSGVNLYAYLPPNYDPSKQSPWVFYSHGSGQSGATAFYSGNESYVIAALANAGYVVVTTDESNASLQCWGNASCVQDVQNMVASWRAMLNLAARPYAIAESMGGVVLWNAIFYHAIPEPLAVVGIYPTYNLYNNYTYNSGTSGLPAQIQAAFNFSNPSQFPTATAGYDPSGNAIATYASIPMDIWCSPNDLVVQCSANGEALVNAVNAAGGSATYNATTGTHGDPSNFNPAAVVAFFQSH